MDTINEADLRKMLIDSIQAQSKGLDDTSLDIASFNQIKAIIDTNIRIIKWVIERKAEPKGKQVQIDTIFQEEHIKKMGELMMELMSYVDNPAIGAVEDACALLEHPQEIKFEKGGVKVETNKCYCCQKKYKNGVIQ